MKEPRKIVFILGNGFDIDLGLKTSYEEFHKSKFCPKDYPAPLIQHLNERWGDDLRKVRWYDLENEFIAYYNKITGPQGSFDVISKSEETLIKAKEPSYIVGGSYDYKDIPILRSLQSKGLFKTIRENSHVKYDLPFLEDLKKDRVWRDHEAFKRINEGLCQYISSLEFDDFDGGNNRNLASFVLGALSIAAEKDFVRIYSFNYTELPGVYKTHFKDSTYHVHGSCSEGNIIVGTRDHRDFNRNYDYLQKAFNPMFYPPAIVSDLLAADDVIIFGHSIGENDQQYFDAFFKQQTTSTPPKRINITIFTYDDCSELDIKRSLQLMTDSKLSVLFSQNNVKIIKKEAIKKDSKPFLDFLQKYIPDTNYRRPLEKRFLSAQIE